MPQTEFARLADLLERVRGCPCSSVDIETPGENSTVVTSIAFTLGVPYEAFVIPLAGRYFSEANERELWWDHIKPTLETVPVIGQNFLFDWGILWENGIKAMTLYWDTMVAQHLLFTEFPRSLEAMIALYTDRKPHKAMINSDLSLYNGIDVVTTHEIMLQQQERMTTEDREEMAHLMRLHPALIQMEKRGLLIDEDYKAEALAEMEKKRRELRQELEDVVGYPLNPQSVPQLRDYFYGQLGLKPYYNKKTGSTRVDEDAMQRIARKGYHSAELVQQIRKYSKLVDTYFKMKIDEDGRLRCQIKLTGTVTGRLATGATSRGTGSNLQNLPPEFGRCVVADPGRIFLEADLEQAEKRIVALLSGDDPDIADFKAGRDIHKKQAALVLGKNERSVTNEERNKIGKKLNHATSYNVGYRTFAAQADIPESKAKALLEEYHRQHPLRAYFRDVQKQLQEGNTLRNLFGRPRRFYGTRDDATLRSAYDFNPQSTTGSIINRGIEQLYYNAPEWLQLMMNVHDSVLTSVPDDEDYIQYAAEMLRNTLHVTLRYNGRELDIPLEFMSTYRWSKKLGAKFAEPTLESVQEARQKLSR